MNEAKTCALPECRRVFYRVDRDAQWTKRKFCCDHCRLQMAIKTGNRQVQYDLKTIHPIWSSWLRGAI